MWEQLLSFFVQLIILHNLLMWLFIYLFIIQYFGLPYKTRVTA